MNRNSNFIDYYDTPRHSFGKLYIDLYSVAQSARFFYYSSCAGEWLREIERQIDDGVYTPNIEQVLNLFCEILRENRQQITTLSFMNQLRKKNSEGLVTPAVEFGQYSICDIGIITCILFDSFSMYKIRMSDFDQCVDQLQRSSM